MSEVTKNTESEEQLLNSFRAYLQVIISAEQFGKGKHVSALPGPKTRDYCARIDRLKENQLAGELSRPVCAILDEIDEAAMFFFRPIFQNSLKDSVRKEEHERILYQLDFALALILRRVGAMVSFRSRYTKCVDLIVESICQMEKGPEAAHLVRRWQKEFPDESDDGGEVFEGNFPDIFAWDTYRRVAALDRLVDEYPQYVKTAARRMRGWPMLVHRHANNKRRFKQIARQLELGAEYPLDASEGARFRPDTPLVRYLEPLIYNLHEVWLVVADPEYKFAKSENEDLRDWLWDFTKERPDDEQVKAAAPLRRLPPLTKATGGEWTEKVVVPYIMATDARDWKSCSELALQQIAKQRGVKSRATFKSRLLAAVSATLRRLARAT